MSRSQLLILVGAVALGVPLLVWVGLPLFWQTVAILLLTLLLPGWLFVEWLVGGGESAPPWWERLLYGVGAGFGIQVVGTLLLSYLPGPLQPWHVWLFFEGIVLALALLVAWRRPAPTVVPAAAWPRSRWLWAGAVLLALVGGFFRLNGLAYAEYQGDEARATERAAAIIQGYEDVLFLHKKGPTEILMPTTSFAMSGRLTEQSARLPFALANLVGLFALWLLGARLFGPVAGWAAALLLAMDGYFIGFSHIVQYQSIVFLTSVLAVLALHRLTRWPTQPARWLVLAALFLATGALSHYEAIFAAIPAAFLLWQYVRQERVAIPALLRTLAPPVLVGAAILALFYLPFVLHPNFSATYTYLADRRIGGSFPYNNLADFFIRTTLYSTTYYVILLIVLAAVAMLWAYARHLGRSGAILGSLAILGLLLTALSPGWLTVGETDLVVLLFALPLLGLWLIPGLSAAERMLWLWFGLPMLIAFFFTEKPRTHVYVFFMPWLLLVGAVVQQIGHAIRRRAGERAAMTVGIGAAALAIALFGSYAYWYFVHNEVEVLRTWRENRPPGYWTVYETPDDKALFGFPLANGWKVVGELYRQGIIEGQFETNEKEAWVPDWYTRGERRCARTADWYFQIENLEPFGWNDQQAMEEFLRDDFQRWGVVQINGAERMIIYQRTDEPIAAPRVLRLEEWAASFDQYATPDLRLGYPAVAPPTIPNPLQVNLDNQIWLEGYALEYEEPLMPGDTFHLTLFWRAQQPIEHSYKVFNHVYFGDSGMQAQLDGFPVCDGRDTWRWDPGELITDEYYIPVAEDATPGLYPLYSGMYHPETGERLPILDEAGNPTDSQIHVTDIRIGKE